MIREVGRPWSGGDALRGLTILLLGDRTRLGDMRETMWIQHGNNEMDSPCVSNVGLMIVFSAMAELTDKGRQSMLDLGSRLRHLYVHQLGFLPETISRSNTIYLRSSPFPRALHSLQQAFTGLYPPNKRDKALPPPTIVTRTLTEETLLPNEDYCQRFIQLIRAYSQRTAQTCKFRCFRNSPWPLQIANNRHKGNHTSEMDYLNRLIQKWMPSKQRVAVDSNPRLHGIWDTINATLATPAASNTRLPVEFYDPKARKIIDSIAVEEEFSGYKESREYRMLGIGALLGEVVQRMVSQVQGKRETLAVLRRSQGSN